MKLLTFCAAAFMPCALAGQESSVAIHSKFTSAPFDVVITEIMADPDPSFGLPVAEYVEILNRSVAPVNLAGWTLFDGSSRSLPGLELLPGTYLVICANADTMDFAPFGQVAGISSLSLTNGGEKIAIRSPAGTAIDSVIYSDAWHESSFKKDGGWSLERIDFNFTCPMDANWKSSASPMGGTPAAINSVNGIFTDSQPPILLRAYCQDSAAVMLVFSEALDPSTLNAIQNYTLTNAPAIAGVSISDQSNTKILLQLTGALTAGTIATVAVDGPADCAGNKTNSETSVRFGIADTGNYQNIVINEVLFDPFEGGYDFVELHNKGNTIIDLGGMRIASINSTTGEPEALENISAEPWLIFPGDLIVLSEKPEIVAAHYRSSYPLNFVSVSGMPSMNVDAGHIAMMVNAERHDEFRYEDDYHFELLENSKGVSLEKTNPSRNSLDPTSWHSAAPASGFATPGLKNSQFSENPGNENEVQIQPEIFSPDHDGQDDVITFSIKTGSPGFIGNLRIYNSSGHMIFENNGNSLLGITDAFSWDGITTAGVVAPPGIYVAVAEIFNTEGVLKKYRLPFVVAVKL